MRYAKLIIGLTGGIGSGKSTVANLFAKRGVTVIDADQLSRDITTPEHEAYAQIIRQFGDEVVLESKHLDRKKIRKLIFANPENRHWLENLLHPLIREEMRLQTAKAESLYCIVVIPLIFETEPNPLLNRILVVDTTEELQKQRTQSRDTHTLAEVEAIMKTQIARAKRLAGADDIIVNDGKLEDLEPQVDKLHQQYLNLAKQSSSSG
jgi:dephospho-CoA kinase